MNLVEVQWLKKKETNKKPTQIQKKTCCDLLAGQGERIYTPEKSCLCLYRSVTTAKYLIFVSP